MYFSNIVNEEIQHFHRITGADFTMSLSDILTSDLFKVEPIIENKIYRIYPLFYCNKVISSNVNDKLMENRCLILQKEEKETYLSFITDSSKDNIIFNEDIHNIKKIGDSLSSEEFNAFVYRLRQTGTLEGSLNFEEETLISGVYATYVFNNVEGQLRNDSGIIVNNKVKNKPLTVKLLNPFFLNAKYTLTFTVFSISGANVCEENKGEFISKDTFSIDLVDESDVAIPLTDYINDSILDFDVTVSISFDVPEIVNSNFNLGLSVDNNDIPIGENIILTATLNGEDNIANYTIQFFEDNVLIGSQATNNEGIASLTYSPSIVGNHVYSVKVIGLTSEVNVLVNKLTSSLSVNIDKENIVYGDEINLTGTLLVNNEPVSDLPVKLYDNNILIDTLMTDNLGKVYFNSNNLNSGNNNLKLVYEETNEHKTSNASINVIVKIPTRIFIQSWTSPPIYAADTTYQVTGLLYNDIDDTLVASKVINVKIDNKSWQSRTTDGTGEFTCSGIISAGTHTLLFSFGGDTLYAPSSITHSVTVIKRNTQFINVLLTSDTVSGYLIQSDTGNPISKARVVVRYDDIVENGTTTDSNGYFSNTLRNAGSNYSPRVWNFLSYDGDYYNGSAYSDLSDLTVFRTSSIVDVSQNNPNLESFNHIGKLIDNLGNPIANATVTITLLSNNYSFTRVTDANGLFEVNTVQDTAINCEYDGQEGILGCSGIVR